MTDAYYIKPEAKHFHCQVERCDAAIYDEADIAGGCEHPGCYRHVLCVGCSFDCVDCTEEKGHTFCHRHICETPLPDHSAIYRCVKCQAAFDAQATKAA